MGRSRTGRVYLVGAGPGDPGLLTVKGQELLSQADVVIYDYLANPVLLEHANKRAELIYVGKRRGHHTMTQKEINQLMVERALKGQKVIRLKGGDPFVFGRGGEEAEDLAGEGIDFEIVPGVSSATAVPAYSGIPLTHRDYASTAAFITGHEDPRKEESNIAWDKLATGAKTLVFLMGVGNLPLIAERLIEHGLSPETPVAVIRKGTFADQKTLIGPLNDIARLATEHGIKPPAVILVGEVVHLREKLNWFERRPLFGKRIVVTRATEQARGFLEEMSGLGAECIRFPTIEVAPPESWDPLDHAVRSLENYQWMLFTSVNGVKYFFERLSLTGKDARDLKGLQIGAIGPKTAEHLNRLGIRPDFMPDEYRSEAIVGYLSKFPISGTNILIPRAAEAREILPKELTRMGARVDVVPAYRIKTPVHDTGRIGEMFEKGSIDMVTFTSSSTVNNFVKMFEISREELERWVAGVAAACIGPITAKTARQNGFSVRVVPSEYTIEALALSIVEYFTRDSHRGRLRA